MSPRWERISGPPPLGETPYLDAELRPHRSLSLQAFRVLLLVVIAINLAVGIVFWLRGAFPVTGFLGLDVLALWIAFRINYRAARAREHVRVEREFIHVERRNPGGESLHWGVSPIWARVATDGLGVTVRSAGKQLRLAAFLSPDEREAFARKLDEALWRAKRGA